VKIRPAQIVLLTIASLSMLSYSSAQTAEICSVSRLASAARKLLKTKFPLWQPKQISDLQEYDRQLWIKAHAKECPGIAIGHFESPTKLAYALLLVPERKSTGGYKIVVLNETDSVYSETTLDQESGQGSDGMVISTAAPGQYSDFENTEQTKIKRDGIYVEWIEKAAVLYYWSAGRYRKLQTSD
jgi:hypothetical protein